MQKQTFEIFSLRAQKHLDDLYSILNTKIELINLTEINDVDKSTMAINLLNEIYKIPNFNIEDAEAPKNEINTENLIIPLASSIIGNGFTYGSNSNTVTITELKSKYNLDAIRKSYQLTVKYNLRNILGNITSDSLTLTYYHQGDFSDEHAQIFKTEKTKLIELLKENNKEVKEYFQSKKMDFLDHIKLRIDEKVTENKIKIQRLNSF